MNVDGVDAYAVTIYVAGDVDDAKRECARWCWEVGNCVTVTQTEFIYTGGREKGVAIGLINYPRFPEKPSVIWRQANELAERLIVALVQCSALVQDHKDSVWITRWENRR